jgi:Flp pilus assembly protein TadD
MALARLADAADASGRPDEALALLRRLVAEAPSSPEVPAAFSRVGKALLDRADYRGAEDWFAARRTDPHPGMAEAALVGLMRLAAHQGRDADLAALKAEYVRRFPGGTRRAEVDRL